MIKVIQKKESGFTKKGLAVIVATSVIVAILLTLLICNKLGRDIIRMNAKAQQEDQNAQVCLETGNGGKEEIVHYEDGSAKIVRFCSGKQKILREISAQDKKSADENYEREEKERIAPKKDSSNPNTKKSSKLPAPKKVGATPKQQSLIEKMWKLTDGDETAIATMEIESGWNPHQREVVVKIVDGEKKLLPVGHGHGICQVDDRHWHDGSVLPNGEKLEWNRYLSDAYYQVHVCTVMFQNGVRMYGSDHTDRAIPRFFWPKRDNA